MKKMLCTLALSLVAFGAFAADQTNKPPTTGQTNPGGNQIPIPSKLTKVWPNPTPAIPGSSFTIMVEADKGNMGGPCQLSVSINGGAFQPLGTATNFTFFSPSSNWHFDNAIGQHSIRVKAEPGGSCTGDVTKWVTVPPQCPQNWTGTANDNGEITCHPLIPATHPQCPPKTEFYQTACSMGCKQVIY